MDVKYLIGRRRGKGAFMTEWAPAVLVLTIGIFSYFSTGRMKLLGEMASVLIVFSCLLSSSALLAAPVLVFGALLFFSSGRLESKPRKSGLHLKRRRLAARTLTAIAGAGIFVCALYLYKNGVSGRMEMSFGHHVNFGLIVFMAVIFLKRSGGWKR